MTATETRPEAPLLVADGVGTALCRRLPDLPCAHDPAPDTDQADASADSRPAGPPSPAKRSTP
ncbi:hypothetical protein AB0N62_33045 [Streptomyces sp. NPDC093982]|uniref:hypothetical protein n=1 Tax=Streptomyces sp. NPDC093982 TaxID=3155077 RepID=UPI003435B495